MHTNVPVHMLSLFIHSKSLYIYIYLHTSRQRPHHRLKRQQSHSIRRERSEKARQKPAPIPPPPSLLVDGRRGILPVMEPPLTIPQRTTHRVRHDALLHHIRRVRGDPEHLGGETAGPEVDGRGGHVGVLSHPAGEDVV